MNEIQNISNNIDNVTSQHVIELREVMIIMEANHDLIKQFTVEFRKLRHNYMGLVSEDKSESTGETIEFLYIGRCNKSRDPRKRGC